MSGKIPYTGDIRQTLQELVKRATVTDIANKFKIEDNILEEWGYSDVVTLDSVGAGFVYKNTTITFAPAFAVAPDIFVSLDTFTGASIGWNVNTISKSATTVVVQIIRAGGAITDTARFHWRAIGQKVTG